MANANKDFPQEWGMRQKGGYGIILQDFKER